MRLWFFIIVVAVTSLASTMSSDVQAAGRGTVELELIGTKTYRWDGRDFDYQAIATALAEADAEKPIKKLILVDPDDDASIADLIDFAMLAPPIGAKAYNKIDGTLRKITLNIGR